MNDNPDTRRPWLGEGAIVQRSASPVTRDSIAADLRALGLTPGMTVIVHSSLSSLGWVNGGPEAVVPALMDVVSPEGTIVMPTFSTGNSEPSDWEEPPVPKEWWEEVRATMPPFNPITTPTRLMGVIVELFRTWPGVVRSNHPANSFAAWGRNAEQIVSGQTFAYSMGENSPLARIYDRDGYVLLLGVGFGNNSSFHLAEYRAPNPPPTVQGSSVLIDGAARWVTYDDVLLDDEEFPAIGTAFEATGQVTVGTVGIGTARLFRQRPAVDFAVDWITRSRAGLTN